MRLLLVVTRARVARCRATASVIVSREFDSPALQRKWTYAVYLPDGYETSTLRYPVLYLLHGHNGKACTTGRTTGTSSRPPMR